MNERPSGKAPEPASGTTFKLTLEYDGTGYSGWQRQKNGATVQATLEDALSVVLGSTTVVAGSGRTDAGVHALGQVASFQAETRLRGEQLCAALNSHLPRDVTVLSVERVAPGFHARISAVSKRYRYRILNRPVRCSLDRLRCLHVPEPLDLSRMREAARHLVGTHDFRAFACKVPPERSCVRTLNCVDIERAGPYIHVDVEADGFLQRMVRTIVGTLLSVGLNRMDPARVPELIETGNRSDAGPSAPAHGLFLVRVDYEARKGSP